eukprot:3436643-Prymnesium_polylepis.3
MEWAYSVGNAHSMPHTPLYAHSTHPRTLPCRRCMEWAHSGGHTAAGMTAAAARGRGVCAAAAARGGVPGSPREGALPGIRVRRARHSAG